MLSLQINLFYSSTHYSLEGIIQLKTDIELKMLDFSDRIRTSISILISAAKTVAR